MNQEWGQGAAIAFILFVIIVVFTIFQRWVLRERKVSKRRMRLYQPALTAATAAAGAPGSVPAASGDSDREGAHR